MNAIRSTALLAAVILTSVIVAGCGSGVPKVASLPPAASTTLTAANGSAASFMACMRSHGVPNFPSPKPGGSFTIEPGSGVDPNSPQYRSALASCQALNVKGGSAPPPVSPKAQAQALKFSACMRSNGEPAFPSPSSSGGHPGFNSNGIDKYTTAFRNAERACHSLLPTAGNPATTTP
jgi:hypothetical protein